MLKEQHGLAIKELESEIHLLKTKEKPAVLMPCDHEEEMNQLQVSSDAIITWEIIESRLNLLDSIGNQQGMQR